jgi:nickel/cobalt exporter
VDDFTSFLQHGAADAWLFIPSAILIGALHGLEPGHSKTMMAAFIVAIRGTIGQAALLGVCAAFSHSLVIWVLAAAGLAYGQQLHAEKVEPYFQAVSGIIVILTAVWMARRTYRDIRAEAAHDHGHHTHEALSEEDHVHGEYQDVHERQHAVEIEKRLATREVSTGQIVLFGLTGGLVPCPAALTVLFLCLQLKKFTLGFTLVLCFSFGLALTLVATGAIAAWSVHHAAKRFKGISRFARRAPYFSSALITLLGIYMLFSGLHHL